MSAAIQPSRCFFFVPPSPRAAVAGAVAGRLRLDPRGRRHSWESPDSWRHCAPQVLARVGAIQGVAVAGSSLRWSVRHKCERTRDDPASAEAAGVSCLVAWSLMRRLNSSFACPNASLCNHSVCSSTRHNPFTETLDNWAFGSYGEATGPRVLRCHHAARRINSSVLDFRLPP